MTVVNDQTRTGEPAMSLTSVEVRDQRESLLERDLLGPWDGPEEELPPGTSPAERYLLGRLVPYAPHPGMRLDDTVADSAPETVDREIVGVDHDDDVEPEATVRAGSVAASSLGLSFSVEVPLVLPGVWMPGLVLDMARLGSPELAGRARSGPSPAGARLPDLA